MVLHRFGVYIVESLFQNKVMRVGWNFLIIKISKFHKNFTYSRFPPKNIRQKYWFSLQRTSVGSFSASVGCVRPEILKCTQRLCWINSPAKMGKDFISLNNIFPLFCIYISWMVCAFFFLELFDYLKISKEPQWKLRWAVFKEFHFSCVGNWYIYENIVLNFLSAFTSIMYYKYYKYLTRA